MFANHQHKFNKEIAELISTSAMASPQGIPSSEVISHLSYLASFVESIHSVDLPAEEPVPTDHTYTIHQNSEELFIFKMMVNKYGR